MLSMILNEVRRDALQKVKKDDWSKEELGELMDVLSRMILMAELAREEGLLSLEEEAYRVEVTNFLQELIKRGAIAIVDAYEPEELEDYLTTLYWVYELQGMEALASYCIIKGLTMIQLNKYSLSVQKMLLATLPLKYQEVCLEAVNSTLDEYRKMGKLSGFADN